MSSPVLVDTDPGIDDALALHYLVATGGTSALDPQLGLGQVALGLAREEFAGHFVATLDAQASLQ